MGLSERSLTIRFGVKDKDIAPFMKGVGKGVFSFVVKSMIRSYMNNESVCDLGSLINNAVENPGIFTKNLSMGLEDEDVYEFIMSIEQSCRSDKVKDIIRIYTNQLSVLNNSNNSLTRLNSRINIKNENQISSPSRENITDNYENNISTEDIERLNETLFGDD